MTLTPLFIQHTQKMHRGKNIEYYANSKKAFFDATLYTRQKEDGKWESVQGGFLFNNVEEVGQKAINELTAKELGVDFNDYSNLYYIHAISSTLNNDLVTYLIDLGDNVFIIKAKEVILIDEDIYVL
ncbi:hypothetical protein [Chryseobacterium mucoviscidosis]|uniref:hypothetical protein n=1 Tax=Chryseobacterium mucoviscidosis TaxID=1945581 RepID=UPI003016BF7F